MILDSQTGQDQPAETAATADTAPAASPPARPSSAAGPPVGRRPRSEHLGGDRGRPPGSGSVDRNLQRALSRCRVALLGGDPSRVPAVSASLWAAFQAGARSLLGRPGPRPPSPPPGPARDRSRSRPPEPPGVPAEAVVPSLVWPGVRAAVVGLWVPGQGHFPWPAVDRRGRPPAPRRARGWGLEWAPSGPLRPVGAGWHRPVPGGLGPPLFACPAVAASAPALAGASWHTWGATWAGDGPLLVDQIPPRLAPALAGFWAADFLGFGPEAPRLGDLHWPSVLEALLGPPAAWGGPSGSLRRRWEGAGPDLAALTALAGASGHDWFGAVAVSGRSSLLGLWVASAAASALAVRFAGTPARLEGTLWADSRLVLWACCHTALAEMLDVVLAGLDPAWRLGFAPQARANLCLALATLDVWCLRGPRPSPGWALALSLALASALLGCPVPAGAGRGAARWVVFRRGS